MRQFRQENPVPAGSVASALHFALRASSGCLLRKHRLSPQIYTQLKLLSCFFPSERVDLSQTEAILWLSFRPIFLDKKFGRNWNRTSDTRIFSLENPLPYLALDFL